MLSSIIECFSIVPVLLSVMFFRLQLMMIKKDFMVFVLTMNVLFTFLTFGRINFLCVIIPVDVWNHIHDVLLPKYSQELNGMNIISGPIFDKDFDGNVDPLEASSG